MKKLFKSVFILILTLSLLTGCSAVQAIKKNSSPTNAVTAYLDALKVQDIETLNGVYAGDANQLKIEEAGKYVNDAFDEQTKKIIFEKLLEFTYVIDSETITEPEEVDPEAEEGAEAEKGSSEGKDGEEGLMEEDGSSKKDKKAVAKEEVKAEADKKQTIMADADKIDDLPEAAARAEAKRKESELKKAEEASKAALSGSKKTLVAEKNPTTAVVEVTITTINYGQVVNDSLKKYFEEMAATANPGETVDFSIYNLEMLVRENVQAAAKDYVAKFTITLTKYDKEWMIDPLQSINPFFNAYYGNAEGTVPAEPPTP